MPGRPDQNGQNGNRPGRRTESLLPLSNIDPSGKAAGA
ncbi:hypothetical protein AB434_3373 [Heyndrickxia coagulans]|uniref:Uncharacterized protein n=1 Tax=Heyndrickxia coagulans TaxID=1398 RepID=A0AAN0T4H3_HEYCO|nr:hypothetical protein SB48_HM08orf03020 [Heyndrickxia coagulans]AKN55778.1 hypothetical protein AB434_3373 [Heyndrickxia coagulans]